jgi:hypothetical protein
MANSMNGSPAARSFAPSRPVHSPVQGPSEIERLSDPVPTRIMRLRRDKYYPIQFGRDIGCAGVQGQLEPEKTWEIE